MKNIININWKLLLIIPLITGFLAVPSTSEAAWTDIFGGSSTYDTNSTSAQNTGSIKLNKKVRRVNRDQDYHETTTIRSGDLVEIWIEVKNDSNGTAQVTVTDELPGGFVYKASSLLVNGQTSAPGLTSGGLRLNFPAKSTAVITYQGYMCSGSTYAVRAYAYSAGVGSATDAIILQDENAYNYGGYNNYSSCVNQVTPTTTGTGTYNGPSITSSGNPFSDWTGVNNSGSTSTAGNPFGDWSGVNSNTTSNTTTNPFGNWTGVNNASSSSTNNPFGDWTGVNNAGSSNNSFRASTTSTSAPSASTSNNVLGTWTGVNNSSSVNNPFGDWTGVNNTGSSNSNNPFGDWTGVNNYDSRGYQTNTSTSSTNSDGRLAYTPSSGATVSYASGNGQTYYVAPKTGVDKTAPLIFAGLLVLGFFGFRHRRLLFN